jgi:integrase
MACIRKRRNKWVVDFRDAAGVRRWVTCPTRREAETVLERSLRDTRQPTRPVVDLNITLSGYAERWLAQVAATAKPRTVEGHRETLRLHLVPRLGAMKLRLLQRGTIKALLADKLGRGQARGSVRIMHATLRALLNAAIEDGVIAANPAARLGRSLRLVPVPAARQEQIKAFTRAQLAIFLLAAREHARRLYPLFLLLARAGLRLGEALALQWDDLDLERGQLRVVRALSRGRLETPKSGHGRTVDVSPELVRTLRRLRLDRTAETLKCGWSAMPPWVFCSETGTPLDTANVRHVFTRILKRGGLPRHFSPHCLRHTFASLLLQRGESPVYVQRQLGHASIKLTVDTYGRWLPVEPLRGGVAGLDEPSGSSVVANRVEQASGGGLGASEVPETVVVSRGGIEPPTPCLKGRCSTG